MSRQFSGWHMFAILFGGFGVVVAVNLLMANLAVGTFGGVVVENSYVASQEFNGWLAEAERENALGWQARVGRAGDGHLWVETERLPKGVRATAELRHPLGREEAREWKLEAVDGGFRSIEALPEGRWLVRLTLSQGEDTLRIERPVG